MLRLSLLGSVSLTAPDVANDLASRGWQRAVLLALLGGAGPRGMTRDRIITLLWPDADEGRARHSLNEVVSRLRRDTARPGIVEGTTRLVLNGADVSVDAWDFNEAVRARHVERALELHRGRFAEGVRTAGLVALEQTLDTMRGEYRRAFEEIGELAARQAAEGRDFVMAARFWQRLVDADPLSERLACELVAAYAAIPDAARALRSARLHEALVVQELGVKPGVRIREWSERLARLDTPTVQAPSLRETSAQSNGDQRSPLDRLRAQLPARYALSRILEEGRLFVRARAHVPGEGAREVDIYMMQPRAAAFVREGEFLRAMERAASLVAATIVPTLDFAVRGDVVYFVTSPMPSPTLREMLRREGALAVDASLRCARSVATALESAHSRGLTHGDLRPRHIALLGDGSAVVGGFGIVAALVGDGGDGDDTAVLSYGSPRYLSPEQRQGGRAPDVRSDIYAFGCTLYHALAGEAPALAMLDDPQRVADEMRRRRPSVPSWLAAMVARCLASHPADRFPDASALTRALAGPPP